MTHPLLFKRLVLLAALLVLTGCAGIARQDSPEAKRQAILAMQQDVLEQLYTLKPDVRAQIGSAPGYAVFSNANINVVLASFGGGYGVVTDNSTSRRTYMHMGEVGVGVGLGVKDFRLVFVFHDRDALNRFITDGWAFGVQADAAAKAGNKGAAVGGEASVDNFSIYQITEAGLALQATVKGTKFWPSAELN